MTASVRGSAVVEQDLVNFLLPIFAFNVRSTDNLLQGLVETFSLRVSLRPVWRDFAMRNSMRLKEIRKGFRDKLRAIVRSYQLWKTVCKKYPLKVLHKNFSLSRSENGPQFIS